MGKMKHKAWEIAKEPLMVFARQHGFPETPEIQRLYKGTNVIWRRTNAWKAEGIRLVASHGLPNEVKVELRLDLPRDVPPDRSPFEFVSSNGTKEFRYPSMFDRFSFSPEKHFGSRIYNWVEKSFVWFEQWETPRQVLDELDKCPWILERVDKIGLSKTIAILKEEANRAERQ